MTNYFNKLISITMIFFISLSISTLSFGQDKYSVSGEIIFHEEQGEFQVWLRIQDEVEIGLKSAPPPERILLIKPTLDQLKAKKVTFKFVGIPAGNYCIYCLHDLNKNGELDRVPSTGFPAEPYGYSGQLAFGKPMWEDVRFKVDKDVSGIKINL